MAQSVGGLIADIGLDIGGLRSDIKRANSELKKGTNRMNRHLGSLRKRVDSVSRGFKGLVGAISVGLFARHIKETLDSADQMLKLTQRLGGTTEAFSELEFVANRSGIAFTTLTMGLQRMVRRVAEAAEGFGEAKGALRELNIDAEHLSKLPLDKQFEVIADSLFGVKKEADRVRLAMKLFDSEGVALLQTMTNGAAGIRELRAEAKRLGVTLTRDQAEAAAKAKDAMTDLNAAVGSLSKTLAIQLAPAITKVAKGWELIINGLPRTTAIAKEMATIKRSIDVLGDSTRNAVQVKALTDEYIRLAKLLERIKNGPRNLAGELVELNEIMVTSQRKPDLYGQGLKRLSAKFQTAEMRVKALRKEFELFGEGLNPGQVKLYLAEIENIWNSGLDEIKVTSEKRLPELLDRPSQDLAQRFARSMGMSLQSEFSNAFMGIETNFSDLLRRMAADFAASSLLRSLGSLIPGSFGKFLSAGIPGFAGGGSFKVGGNGGTDSQLVSFRASPDETVSITKPGQESAGGRGISIVNQYSIEAGADWETLQKILPPLFERNREATIAQLTQMSAEGAL